MKPIHEPRDLPQVEVLASALAGAAPAPIVRAEARAVIAEARNALRIGRGTDLADLRAAVLKRLRRRQPMGSVINATGVLLHTNLGRAPLEPLERDVNGLGPVPIELALDDGRRHHRLESLEADICELTGARAATVVNNGAAALLLVLSALAHDGDVIISRGQLVEIGGSFRVGEIVGQGGASVTEVGTTNRTHLDDFRRAITSSTRVLLEVHRSNFEQTGFTASVPTRDLASLARENNLVMVNDIGSGLCDSHTPWLSDGPPVWLRDEPAARQVLEAGAHVVTFSGDKLLGGPQAGIICGDGELLDRVRRHPLARALRYDKVRAAHLHATVRAHLDQTATAEVPFWRMATAAAESLLSRATAVAHELEALGIGAEAVPVTDVAGGGAAASRAISGWGVALNVGHAPDVVAIALRMADPPLIGIIRSERVVLSFRTVDPHLDHLVVAAIARALSAIAQGDSADGSS